MKKTFSILFISLVIIASSCSQRTCPTYTKAPVEKTTGTSEFKG